MLDQTQQESLRELERLGVHASQLVDCVQKLKEDWCALVRCSFKHTQALGELVSEIQPLALDEHREALQQYNYIHRTCSDDRCTENDTLTSIVL